MDLKAYEYVRRTLRENGGEKDPDGHFPFRLRSEHIARVYRWAERLLHDGAYAGRIDRDAVLTAALFHDAGYTRDETGNPHAENSARIFCEYADSQGMDANRTEFIAYLIMNHSRKDMMGKEDTAPELILLMEADLLDETGALSVVWDCLMEGARPCPSFTETEKHIREYSLESLSDNVMCTPQARAYWEEKKRLTSEFCRQLKQDLALGVPEESTSADRKNMGRERKKER